MNYKDIDWQDIYDSASVIQKTAEEVLLSKIGKRPKLTKKEIEEHMNYVLANIEDLQNDTEDIEYED